MSLSLTVNLFLFPSMYIIFFINTINEFHGKDRKNESKETEV